MLGARYGRSVTAGTALQRRFQILREIAHGGFGTVFLVRLLQPDGFSRVVAVKLLHTQWSENAEVAGRMRDEARLLGLLRHRNIIDVMDLTRLDGRVAIVMEYVEAADTKSIIKDLADRGERMPVATALQIIAQAASALDAAYNKAPLEGERPLRVVHRDIKPSNLMVDEQGVVKVLDFGVARADFDEREAETKGMAFGSYDYMPSERRFMESGGETSDVYSLGAVLFELIALEKIGKGKLKDAAHRLWVDERVAALVAKLPGPPQAAADLEALLTAMLAFSPEHRPHPADVVGSLRKLARAFDDGDLDDWAPRIIPRLVVAAREARSGEEPHPLVGATLVEDRLLTGDLPPAPPPPRTFDDATPIPKRVRDAVPSRPAVTGTVTPAPLRPRAEVGPSGTGAPHAPYTPPQRVPRSSAPGEVGAGPAADRGEPPPDSPLVAAVYAAIWVVAVLTLLIGGGALLGALMWRFAG
jgi:eukaryotic-like serine/threonine-protein kinase